MFIDSVMDVRKKCCYGEKEIEKEREKDTDKQGEIDGEGNT